MFLFIDESERGAKKVIGSFVIPTNLVPDFEKDIAIERIRGKLFGEIKWSSISGDNYHLAYLRVLDCFWTNAQATFHSCSYTRINDRYKAAYMLIRAISWKIENQNRGEAPEPLYILFDDGGDFGRKFFPTIKTMLARDPSFHHEISFCSAGHSHVMGSLQVADLLTGAVASRINNVNLSRYPKKVLEEIEKKNNGQIGVSINRFPRLLEFKMHHYDLVRLNPTI